MATSAGLCVSQFCALQWPLSGPASTLLRATYLCMFWAKMCQPFSVRPAPHTHKHTVFFIVSNRTAALRLLRRHRRRRRRRRSSFCVDLILSRCVCDLCPFSSAIHSQFVVFVSLSPTDLNSLNFGLPKTAKSHYCYHHHNHPSHYYYLTAIIIMNFTLYNHYSINT